MFNRSEILRTAWAAYRATSARLGGKGLAFSRKRFALALRMAWFDAKQLAFFVALEIEEAAEAVANPAKAQARSDLRSLQMKDRWTPADYSRASALNGALAA